MLARRIIRLAPRWLAIGLAVVAAVPPAAGIELGISVGRDGELYVLRQGTYEELFPGQGLAAPGNAVLAVDVVRPDRATDRLLVPGTETADTEDGASILFEDQSGTLFVLWQARVNVIHSRLQLAGLHGGEWTELVEVSGNPFGWKSSLQLAVTRDTFHTESSDGALETWVRTVAHLLWWEEGPAGEPLPHYSPVTFLNGVYTGWNPVFLLEGFDPAEAAGSLVEHDSPVARAPRIEAGRNGQSVVLAFVSTATGALVTTSVEVLPGEVAFIADIVRHQIVDLGREYRDKPDALASKVRHQIVDLGRRLGLHPSFAAYAAQSAADEIVAALPAENPRNLAERVRHQIVDLGARMTDRGLNRANAAARLQVLETSSGDSGAPPNLVCLLEASVREVPQTGELENALFLSPSGREVVASWVEDGVVYYRESRGAGWSDGRPLRLGSQLPLAQAREILERRADERSDE